VAILAEISDKMLTVTEMWFFMGAVALPMTLLAATRWWMGMIILTAAIASSGLFIWAAYGEAYLEGSFSESIHSELGGAWVTHSLVSPLLPTVAVALVIAIKLMKRHARHKTAPITVESH